MCRRLGQSAKALLPIVVVFSESMTYWKAPPTKASSSIVINDVGRIKSGSMTTGSVLGIVPNWYA